eukprot:XP_011669740.1 PREDICTED: uncharacterized protein LOC105440867 [Strongylocentrotus purpuratus]
MGGFCLLYLFLLLLMRSGDVETNPGPNTAESTVSEVEFLKLAQDIDPSYYYNVGISLGFSHAQLKANLIENLKNFKNAFMDVFMKWNVKQQPPHSNKRQLLADKLREIDLGGLSDRLFDGPNSTEPLQGASSSRQPQQTSHRSTEETENISGRQEDFDEQLTTVARKVARRDEIDNLGKALGFEPEDIQRYVDTNMKNSEVSYMGTLSMLRDWRNEQTKATECEALKDVLKKAGQIRLANILFGGPSRPLESQSKPPSADAQTKPLSPELIERCARDFKFKYRSTVCKIRADPLCPISIVQFDDMYTNLVSLEEHGTEKRMLDYNDILDLKVNGEFPKRIMVQGEKGAGKTTLCAKIAWDWTKGRHFSHFVWVLIVPLREFKHHTIGEIAKSYLDKSNPATVSQITEYIRSNPNKVFIAFDGLDEVSCKIMKTESCESQPTDQMQLQPSQPSVSSSEACGSSSETGDIGLVDILCSEQLASCPVLGVNMNCLDISEELHFIVDLAFESQDPDVAALVKDRVSSEETKFNSRDDLFTKTVNVNDTEVMISMTSLNNPDEVDNVITWMKDGSEVLTSFDGQTQISFPNPIQTSDQGIYEIYYYNERNQNRGGLYRLIVRECPAGKWGPPECYGICDKCYNGGVCDDKSGLCICPNNFKGPNCLESCTRGTMVAGCSHDMLLCRRGYIMLHIYSRNMYRWIQIGVVWGQLQFLINVKTVTMDLNALINVIA